ncbi:YncE family protein [Lichenibacterium dinghuense]|uniref:YncE family protein n=1 Tax=Lichenibacterium dinghuense TaxID=2895977 RepID=UPI001F1CB823|nr:hypothetical protein [Lichenibacterium sp. 6Y81]
MKSCAIATAIAGLGLAGPAAAYDGWHLEKATVVPGPGSAWDYLAMDDANDHLMIGHRKQGLQVFDPKTGKVVKTIAGTAEASSNGAAVIPEFDLGVSNDENGSVIPFKLSTLEAMAPIKLGEELDTSHYDRGSHRLVVNMGAGKDGTDLVLLDVPSMKPAGHVKVDSQKVEGADGDGKAGFFLAARDLDKVYKIDVGAEKVTATYDVAASCGQPTAVAVDVADDRVMVGCRGHGAVKPSLTVLDGATGKVVYTAEIGGGVDSVVYDADGHRIFTANGISANINVFEQDGPDSYKPVETLGTRAGLRTLAMDRKTKLLYGVAAEGTADASKKILTSVSPFYANTFFPDTFTVLTYGK